MRLKLLSIAAAGIALSGCAGGISAANQDVIAQAVAAKIPYCSGDIQISAGIGGIAGTGTGITNNGQLHCPGASYPAPAPAPPAAPTPK